MIIYSELVPKSIVEDLHTGAWLRYLYQNARWIVNRIDGEPFEGNIDDPINGIKLSDDVLKTCTNLELNSTRGIGYQVLGSGYRIVQNRKGGYTIQDSSGSVIEDNIIYFHDLQSAIDPLLAGAIFQIDYYRYISYLSAN